MASVSTLYQRLFQALGPQRWWPARTPFEMMVGAILTQATNWRNVEQAIQRLRAARALHPHRLATMPRARLERLIRASGYFRQKAKRLQQFCRWYIQRYAANARRMFQTPWPALRRELLALHGIGPETADSILLYAGRQPVFVVDAYTTRIFQRHRLIPAQATYAVVQALAMRQLPADVTVYNESHALLVAVGKRFCHRQAPDCHRCPLGDLPHTWE
jgi:endonuclease-3 related protein